MTAFLDAGVAMPSSLIALAALDLKYFRPAP